ncbi:uncharacterized protein LOC134828983 [Culicoides brevitarsis]|uniref:uncharacterized protein LOC134828983 n=1 Tax=Culicoides brevitarsis TaxID=469753 RepID=UPI00307B2DF8
MKYIYRDIAQAQDPPYGTPITDSTEVAKLGCLVLVKSTKECSGVMVGPRHVVTAAQCVSQGAKVAASATVTSVDANGQITSNSKTVKVDKIVVHDSYAGGAKEASIKIKNDIAFLKLNTEVNPLFTDGTFKKCKISPTKAEDGTSVLIIGNQIVNAAAKTLGLVEYSTKIRTSNICKSITDPGKKNGYCDTLCTSETKNLYCPDSVIGGGMFDTQKSVVYGINLGTTYILCNSGTTYFGLNLPGFAAWIDRQIKAYP